MIISLVEITFIFKVLRIIFRALLKGRKEHILAKTSPTKSEEKYIPLVKQTNCTKTLDTPLADLTLVTLPINIPKKINVQNVIQILFDHMDHYVPNNNYQYDHF